MIKELFKAISFTTIFVFIIGFILLYISLYFAEYRTDKLMEYGDCVAEYNAGSSIPLEDAWVIYQDLCQN